VNGFQTALSHDLYGLGVDVDRCNRQASVLKDKAMKSGSCAYIQDVASAVVERRFINGRGCGGIPKEVTHGKRVSLTIIPTDDQFRFGISIEIGAYRQTEGRHSSTFHFGHLVHPIFSFFD
jgi:hypothetical protein